MLGLIKLRKTFWADKQKILYESKPFFKSVKCNIITEFLSRRCGVHIGRGLYVE